MIGERYKGFILKTFLHRAQFKKPIPIRNFFDTDEEAMYVLNEELAEEVYMSLRSWKQKSVYLIPGSIGVFISWWHITH